MWRCVPTIRVRTVRRKLRTVKRGAEPGPSGWRNSLLVAIGERPTGAQELTRWCRQYSLGAIPARDAHLWSSVQLVPLDKGGSKVRPIALGEALPKLAQACLLDTIEPHLRSTFEPHQLSVRTAGGAEILVRTLRAWMAKPGKNVLLQIDLKNAYGQTKRSHTLAAVIRRCPALAPQLAQQWEPGATRAWVRVNGCWEWFESHRGGWQGSPDSNPAFCYGLEDAFAKAMPEQDDLSPECSSPQQPLRRLGYADDTFLDADPETLLQKWPAILAALQEAGHEVNATKCNLWTGADSTAMTAGMQAALQQLCETFPANAQAIKIMGTEAGSAYTTAVGEPGAMALAAQARSDKAVELCKHVQELATTDIGIPRLGAAWTLLSKCCARALDYDARLVPSGALDAATSALDAALRDASTAICAKTLDDDAWDQLTLPGPLAGCGLRLPSAMADVALWASWEAHQSRARDICTVLHREADHADADEEARLAAEVLQRRGVVAVSGRKLALTDAAATFLNGTGWDSEPETNPPAQRVRHLGECLRLLERLQAGRLWQRSDATQRTRLLSAGGAQAGMLWTALPDSGSRTMPDEHWRIATAARLGILRCPPGISCGLPRARGKGCCGRTLDQWLRHVWHCKTGAARLRIHRALQMTLMRELRQSGGHVDVERAMPSMATIHPDGTIEESIMDVTVWWPGTTAWFGIDVTIRYAGASRYYGADRKAGTAAAAAEREKHRRYGRDVLPLAFEAGGRLGELSLLTLRRLADTVATAAGGQHLTTRQGMLTQWRRRLEAALHFAAADAVLNALSQSEAGRQVATRWGFTSAVPPALQAHVDGEASRSHAACAVGAHQNHGDPAEGTHAEEFSLQVCLPVASEEHDLLATGLADLITAEEEAGLLPAEDLLTADEEAAWQLFAC